MPHDGGGCHPEPKEKGRDGVDNCRCCARAHQVQVVQQALPLDQRQPGQILSIQVEEVKGDEGHRNLTGSPGSRPPGMEHARGEAIEVHPAVDASDKLAVEDGPATVEGVHQPRQFWEGVGDLATGRVRTRRPPSR